MVMRHLTLHGKIIVYGGASLFLTVILLIGMGLRQLKRPLSSEEQPAPLVAEQQAVALQPTKWLPVREIPERFRADTHRPNSPEAKISGGRVPEQFSPGRDLTYIDDTRVFWESDNDTNDDECDHSMHKAMEQPLRLLIELVHAADGTLEVHDSYRASGIHNARSLHKEGRAIDLTCDELGLEELSKLCWAAGFDWVYHEASSRGGAHVHSSVRPDHVQPSAFSSTLLPTSP